MITREQRISKKKADELKEKGIVSLFENKFDALSGTNINWKLDDKEFLISPSGKLRISFRFLNRLVLRAEKILRELKKLNIEQETNSLSVTQEEKEALEG